MSEKEFAELINEKVSEAFTENREIISRAQAGLMKYLYPANEGELYSLNSAVIDYTYYISEIICAAMAKCLISAGILDIHSDEK